MSQQNAWQVAYQRCCRAALTEFFLLTPGSGRSRGCDEDGGPILDKLGNVGRTRFLSFRDGYHGDTLAAMSVTDPDEGMHALFKGYLPEQIIAPIPRRKLQGRIASPVTTTATKLPVLSLNL